MEKIIRHNQEFDNICVFAVRCGRNEDAIQRTKSYLTSRENDETGFDRNSWIELCPENENLYDPNAIKVISKGEIFGYLGYVGREFTEAVRRVLSVAKNPVIYVEQIRSGSGWFYGEILWNAKE